MSNIYAGIDLGTNSIKIVVAQKNNDTFNDLLSNPICNMYNLERLKHDLNEFYSFRLSKSGGLVRLIIYYNDKDDAVYLVFISYNHYNDFNRERVIYYDE